MEKSAHHELHDIDVVGAEAQHEAQQNQQYYVLGPATFSRLASHGVLLGHLGKLGIDLAVAAKDKSQGQAEPNNTGKQKHIWGFRRFIQVGVLHACLLTFPLINHAPEEHRRCLQENNRPDQNADASYHFQTPQLQTPVWMHHGQVAVSTDAGHECDARVGV